MSSDLTSLPARRLYLVTAASQAVPTTTNGSVSNKDGSLGLVRRPETDSLGPFGAALRWVATPTLFLLLGAHMLNPQGGPRAKKLQRLTVGYLQKQGR